MHRLNQHIVIVDLGIGNLFSIEKACAAAGMQAVVSSRKHDIETAAALILPGVGAFANAMHTLEDLGLTQVLNVYQRSGRPMLGICLGMQLFMQTSDEFGRHTGLGFIPGVVTALAGQVSAEIPHIGWSPVFKEGHQHCWKDTLLEGFSEFDHQYFVHSYFVRPQSADHVLAWTDYECFRFASVIQKDNVTGCQFHPERSGVAGLQIYRQWGLQNDLLQDPSQDDTLTETWSLPRAV